MVSGRKRWISPFEDFFPEGDSIIAQGFLPWVVSGRKRWISPFEDFFPEGVSIIAQGFLPWVVSGRKRWISPFEDFFPEGVSIIAQGFLPWVVGPNQKPTPTGLLSRVGADLFRDPGRPLINVTCNFRVERSSLKGVPQHGLGVGALGIGEWAAGGSFGPHIDHWLPEARRLKLPFTAERWPDGSRAFQRPD